MLKEKVKMTKSEIGDVKRDNLMKESKKGKLCHR